MQRAQVRALQNAPARLSTVTRRTPFSPLASRRLAPLAALGAAIALAGCQTQSPIQTDVPYQPADGVAVDLGSVQIRNLVVVADAKGGPGVLSGYVVNRGGSSERITIASEGGAPVTVEASAYQAEDISQDSQVQLSSVPVEPGDALTVTVQSERSGANIVQVPVLPATGYYETLRPTSAPAAAG